MKLLITVLLALFSLPTIAQTVKVKIKQGKLYTTSMNPLKKEKPLLSDDEFKLTSEIIDKYFVAEYKGEAVYLEYDDIEKTKLFDRFFDRLTISKAKYNQKHWQENLTGKAKEMVERFGKQYGLGVYLKEPAIGMTKTMIEEMFGKPASSEQTIDEYGKRDVWVYIDNDKSSYYWFESEILKSFTKVSN